MNSPTTWASATKTWLVWAMTNLPIAGKASQTSPGDNGTLPLLHDRLLTWYAHEARDFPWRETRDPYHTLVAEVMLQQTGVTRVLPTYKAFLERFPNIQSLATAPAADVIRAWSGMGYNRRAVNLQRATQAIVSNHEGRVPQDVDTLLNLPGIGPYTAAAVACFAFGQPVAVVDTNIRRVLGRLLLGAESISLKEAWQLAHQSMPPAEHASAWSQALMDIGSTHCLPAKPRCDDCPLHDLCIAAPTFADETPDQRRARKIKVAESRPTQGYYGTSRYYRGRIVDALRRGDGPLAILDLGPLVKPEYSPTDDEAWLRGLIAGLEHDGLLRQLNGDTIALP